MTHKALLKDAVLNHQLASREGALERLFTWWFGRFVYNQIWEDPRIDLQATQLRARLRDGLLKLARHVSHATEDGANRSS